MLINILLAFFFDILIGDPVFLFHPVRLVGFMLTSYEKLFYRLRFKIIGGLLLVLSALLTVFFVIYILDYIKQFLYLPFSINVVSILLIYFIFCSRDMTKEARSVYTNLREGNLEKARASVSRIVGRDTNTLDEKGIIRAAVESLAENVVDGFTAPLFYLIIGGIPLAYVYKTVNTIDSLFGYRNRKYERFGKIGARIDDILNYIPARLNSFFILCASQFKKDVFMCMKVYGRKHPSPNSGISEAGFSGFLGLSLGGDSIYEGEQKMKPWIGVNRLSPRELEDPLIILKAVSFYWRVVCITLIAFLIALYLLNLPIIFK